MSLRSPDGGLNEQGAASPVPPRVEDRRRFIPACPWRERELESRVHGQHWAACPVIL